MKHLLCTIFLFFAYIIVMGQSETEVKEIQNEILQAYENYYKVEKYSEALPVFEKHRKVLFQYLKEKPEDLKAYYTLLLTCYQKTGKQKEYEDLLAYIESSWINLDQESRKAYKSGDYKKALEYLERGKVQAEEEFGRKHKNFVTTCNNLAILYEKLGSYFQAEALFIEAKNIQLEI